MNVTPAGRAPVVVSAGAGRPVAVIVNVPAVPAVPAVKDVASPLVIDGACVTCVTVRVNACTAFAPTPFAAVIVTG